MEFPVQFPDPRKADNDGLVAVGGKLTPEYLLSAYAQGAFPWFNEGQQILWWSPNPRMVLFPEKFKFSKSLRQLVRSLKFEIRVDTVFAEVISNCGSAVREDQDGTWITSAMKAAYTKLHEMGYAHSFETFMNGKLVGGLYGLSLGKAFFGESMFYVEANASKFALYYLVEWCKKHDIHFIDVQQSTSHLKSLGAIDVERDAFLMHLDKSLDYETFLGKWTVHSL
jgi:leucyl/phenylalanyl-tRNA--protein transferase